MLTQRRREKLEAICPDAMDHYDRIASGEPQPAHIIDADRAGGGALCETCDHPLYDHPQHPFVDNCSIIINCVGQFLKL